MDADDHRTRVAKNSSKNQSLKGGACAHSFKLPAPVPARPPGCCCSPAEAQAHRPRRPQERRRTRPPLQNDPPVPDRLWAQGSEGTPRPGGICRAAGTATNGTSRSTPASPRADAPSPPSLAKSSPAITSLLARPDLWVAATFASGRRNREVALSGIHTTDNSEGCSYRLFQSCFMVYLLW